MNTTKSSPSAIYHAKKEKHCFEIDKIQQQVLVYLDELATDLVDRENTKSSLIKKLFSAKSTIKGLYLWGSIGIGKTMLMDCFYEALYFKKKSRYHFHEFMQYLHSTLKLYQGRKDPIKYVAKKMAKENHVICFDEFLIREITDAMLVGRLLHYLYKYGVCFVITANTPPNDLYKNGLQRQNFIPTIKLLNKKNHIIHVSSHKDYRKNFFSAAGVYYTPLNDSASNNLHKAYDIFSTSEDITDKAFLCDRLVHVIQRSDNCIWFEFLTLCGVPRCQADYIALSKQYQYIFISNVKCMSTIESDLVTNFINMVDVFYDSKIKLVMSAEASPEHLYTAGPKLFEFQRTVSRLMEMQSERYFYKK